MLINPNMKIVFFTMLFSIIFTGCNNNKTNQLDIDKFHISVVDSGFINNNSSYKSSHASTVVDCGDYLLSAWFGGTFERHPDVCIYTSIMKNGSWEAESLVADGIESELIRNPCWNPVLYKRNNGDIILYYKVGPSPSKWYGAYKISTDNGVTWSTEHRIPDNLLGPIKNKPIQLPDGILYPTSIEDDSCWKVYLEHSNDELSLWNKINLDNNGFNAIQPTILSYPDKSLQMLCRTKEHVIAESWSHDLGKSWSKMEKTSLPNNNSGIDAVTLSNGVQMLVYNPITSGRNVLSLAISIDGKNWKNILTLENQDSGEFSYPSIIQDHLGRIIVTYTYNRLKIKYTILEIHNV